MGITGRSNKIFGCVERHQIGQFVDFEPLPVAAYVETAKSGRPSRPSSSTSPPSTLLRLACHRSRADRQSGRAVRGPQARRQARQDLVLTTDQAPVLIDTSTPSACATAP
jgi:hypothetical protein